MAIYLGFFFSHSIENSDIDFETVRCRNLSTGKKFDSFDMSISLFCLFQRLQKLHFIANFSRWIIINEEDDVCGGDWWIFATEILMTLTQTPLAGSRLGNCIWTSPECCGLSCSSILSGLYLRSREIDFWKSFSFSINSLDWNWLNDEWDSVLFYIFDLFYQNEKAMKWFVRSDSY